ncbi:MAG: hypothetical protein ACRDTM_07450 [Micromonosporaceae bacterium]
MNSRTWSGPLLTTIVGLVAGAIGVTVLWASGVEFPIYPPPGIVILLAGAAFLALAGTRYRWAPAVGAFLGLFVTVGFLISPDGIPNFLGEHGTGTQIGTWIQMAGVLTALVAGSLATAANYRSGVPTRR